MHLWNHTHTHKLAGDMRHLHTSLSSSGPISLLHALLFGCSSGSPSGLRNSCQMYSAGVPQQHLTSHQKIHKMVWSMHSPLMTISTIVEEEFNHFGVESGHGMVKGSVMVAVLRIHFSPFRHEEFYLHSPHQELNCTGVSLTISNLPSQAAAINGVCS